MNLFEKPSKLLICLSGALCLLIWAFNLNAQVVPLSDISEGTHLSETNNILSPIDKSKIPTGILYDRVFNLAGLERFTGSLGSDTSDVDHFHQAYYEIYNSSYNVTGWKTPDQLDSDLMALFDASIHPIGIMYYNYNEIDTTSIQNNLLYFQNGQLFDVANRTSSPYLNKTTLVTSPLGPAQVEWETGLHTFKLDPAFILTNQSLNISNVTIDFNDGVGLRTLNLNGSIQVNYATPGEKVIKIDINLVGGTILKGTAILGIRQSNLPATTCNGFDIINITGLPFNASQYGGSTNAQSTGTGYIYYATGNCASKKITKPIIFLDGFDPKQKKRKDERTHSKIYSDFINTLVNVNGQDVKLGDKLRNDGYDIIIYDYDDGGDLIEKNALAVVQFLQTLYNNHQNTLLDDFVVIGPSYGSLVAQYALTYCEKNNIPHRTRLYISFDGPQQGANVPIGMQQMADYFTQKGLIAWLKPSLKNGLHHTNAARQMLVHHSNANSEIPAPDSFRGIFQSNLASIGEYPNQCRKVAIINGSNVALSNTLLNTCQEMVHFSMKKLLSSNKKLDWNAYSSAKTSRCESLSMLTDGWLIRLALGGQPKLKKLYTQPIAPNNGYDVAPGGYFEDTFSEYDGKVKLYANIAFGWIRRKEYRHNLNGTFMPSVSAADIRLQSINLNFPFNNLNLACEGITPFDRVYAPGVNEPHVSITSTNVSWFEKEIKGIPPPVPNGSIYTVTINGPTEIPCSSTVTLNASANSGVSTQYIWSFSSPNVDIVAGQGTSSIQVKSINSQPTDLTVTVSVNTKCGTGNTTRAIHSGSPTIPTITNISVTPYGAVNATVSTTAAPPYKWYVDGILVKTGYTKNEQSIPGGSCGYHMLTVDVTNNCGSTNSGPRPEYMYNRSCGMFSVYPNPSNDFLTINLINESTLQKSESSKNQTTKNVQLLDIQITLFDSKMLKVRQTKSNGENVHFNIADLVEGIYYLQIKKGSLLETMQVWVSH